MPLVIPIAGAIEQLQALLTSGDPPPDPLELGLYTNDYTPTRTTVIEDLTEAEFAGYARESLPRSSWGTVEADDDDRARSTFAGEALTFTLESGSPVTIYGHFVANPGTDACWWVERWATPRTLTNAGDSVTLTLPFTYTSEYPPIT